MLYITGFLTKIGQSFLCFSNNPTIKVVVPFPKFNDNSTQGNHNIIFVKVSKVN
ncbi:hypothetical protein Hanom_Chr02g00148601 [Helianthus anomalus]